MRRSKRCVYVNALTIILIVVLGLSFGSTALAQEARLEKALTCGHYKFVNYLMNNGTLIAKSSILT